MGTNCNDISQYKSALSPMTDSTYSNLQSCNVFGGGSVREYTVTKYNYHYPTFNPKNDNEMCYIRETLQPDGQSLYELWHFDICTGKSRFLVKTGSDCSPSWSAKGWIAFTDESSYLAKIKSNGDSLTQYKDIFFMSYPRWNSDGTQLLVSSAGDLCQIDENGKNKKTLLIRVDAADWSSDGQKIVCTRYEVFSQAIGIGVFDMGTKVYSEIQSVTKGSDLRDLQVIKGTDDFYWSHEGNVYKTNTVSKQTTTFLAGSGNRQYRYVTMTPNKKNLLVQRCNRVRLSACELNATNGFSIMDIDGKNEQKFTIPE
jgi:hypothetical protein